MEPSASGAGASRAIREQVREHDVTAWLAGLLADLDRVAANLSRMAVAAPGELRVVNPATLELVGTVAATDPAAVQELVTEAKVAQEAWGETSAGDRRKVLEQVSKDVLRRADEIADTVVAETGKPRVEAYTSELFPALDTLAWLARHAEALLAPERVGYPQLHLKHKRAVLYYEPLGVAAVVAPWNFPFAIPFTQAAYALAAGNAVVVKPSELTPLTGALVARALRRGRRAARSSRRSR